MNKILKLFVVVAALLMLAAPAMAVDYVFAKYSGVTEGWPEYEPVGDSHNPAYYKLINPGDAVRIEYATGLRPGLKTDVNLYHNFFSDRHHLQSLDSHVEQGTLGYYSAVSIDTSDFIPGEFYHVVVKGTDVDSPRGVIFVVTIEVAGKPENNKPFFQN